MQSAFPHYVAPVRTTDEASNEPTHCSFEIRPSVVLQLAWYLILAYGLEHIAQKFTEVRFRFPDMLWLAASSGEENSLSEGFLEGGGVVSAQDIHRSFRLGSHGLRGFEIEVTTSGYFRFLCYHKHTGTEYFSDQVPFKELLCVLRFEHVLVELRAQFRKSSSDGFG